MCVWKKQLPAARGLPTVRGLGVEGLVLGLRGGGGQNEVVSSC